MPIELLFCLEAGGRDLHGLVYFAWVCSGSSKCAPARRPVRETKAGLQKDRPLRVDDRPSPSESSSSPRIWPHWNALSEQERAPSPVRDRNFNWSSDPFIEVPAHATHARTHACTHSSTEGRTKFTHACTYAHTHTRTHSKERHTHTRTHSKERHTHTRMHSKERRTHALTQRSNPRTHALKGFDRVCNWSLA